MVIRWSASSNMLRYKQLEKLPPIISWCITPEKWYNIIIYSANIQYYYLIPPALAKYLLIFVLFSRSKHRRWDPRFFLIERLPKQRILYTKFNNCSILYRKRETCIFRENNKVETNLKYFSWLGLSRRNWHKAERTIGDGTCITDGPNAYAKCVFRIL